MQRRNKTTFCLYEKLYLRLHEYVHCELQIGKVFFKFLITRLNALHEMTKRMF